MSEERLQSSIREKEGRNFEVVETSEGLFRLVYSLHFLTQPKADLGTDYGAVVLESGSLDAEKLKPQNEAGFVQYKEILAELERNKKPLFLVDVGSNLYATATYGLQIAEYMAGKSLSKSARTAMSSGPMSRRELMKQGSKWLAGIYLKTDALSMMLNSVLSATTPRNISRELQATREFLYPQTTAYFNTLRNLIATEKMSAIQRDNNKDLLKGKELVVVYGSTHTGLREALLMEQQGRLGNIERILTYHSFPTLAPQDFARITRIAYDGKKKEWLMTETFNPEILSIAQRAKGVK